MPKQPAEKSKQVTVVYVGWLYVARVACTYSAPYRRADPSARPLLYSAPTRGRASVDPSQGPRFRRLVSRRHHRHCHCHCNRHHHRHVRFQKPPSSLAVTAAADINTASTDANATTSAAAPRRNCHSQLHLPITVFYYHIHHTTHTMQLAPTTVPLLLTHHRPHPPQRRRQPRRKLARQQQRPGRRVWHLT